MSTPGWPAPSEYATTELLTNLRELQALQAATGPIAERTYALRIAELERELAIRNARETRAQEAPVTAPVAEADRRHEDTLERLAATVHALGDIMLELQRRVMLARPLASARTRRLLEGKALTDEQLGKRASDAFAAGASALAASGHPGATMRICDSDDLSPGGAG
jgi:hypothetical protein